jgi:hypothetical protein
MLTEEDYEDIREAVIEDVRHDFVGLWKIPWLIDRAR